MLLIAKLLLSLITRNMSQLTHMTLRWAVSLFGIQERFLIHVLKMNMRQLNVMNRVLFFNKAIFY
ncbi:hypothetical protein NG99_08050 [Erwinia typographi]|uniref:Uncharacterized protein n=1 Tax=Erwinia typographi TaxID=371042 RepID=A0A0A3Z682_9GAMM|nr:hypothetical protein NG99_08050 [Erwinia typographi]